MGVQDKGLGGAGVAVAELGGDAADEGAHRRWGAAGGFPGVEGDAEGAAVVDDGHAIEAAIEAAWHLHLALIADADVAAGLGRGHLGLVLLRQGLAENGSARAPDSGAASPSGSA